MLTPLSLQPAPPGDIAALKDLPLTWLNLYNCKELTGKPVSERDRALKCCLRVTLESGRFFTVLVRRSFPPHLPVPPGDIKALKSMPLTELNLYNCEKLTGKSAVRVGYVEQQSVASEQHLELEYWRQHTVSVCFQCLTSSVANSD